MSTYLDEFFDAYVACALWTSTDDDGDALERDYQWRNLSPEALDVMRNDCARFVVHAGMEDRPNWTADQAGHDFWLTRNGHGTGFWDRGQPDGETLTRYAEEYGSQDLYVGDDGRIYA